MALVKESGAGVGAGQAAQRSTRASLFAATAQYPLPPAILSTTPNPSPEEHADLVVGSPSVNDNSPEMEGSFTLSATVQNSGDGDATATTLRYYRSADATITRSDTQVGTDAVGELSASGTSEESIDLTAPSTAATYYYGACVDAVTGESSAIRETCPSRRPALLPSPYLSKNALSISSFHRGWHESALTRRSRRTGASKGSRPRARIESTSKSIKRDP